MSQGIEVIRHRVWDVKARFSDADLKKRAADVFAELKLLYPKLSSVTECEVVREFQIQDDHVDLIVKLVPSSQNCLPYAKGRHVVVDDQYHLKEVAQAILESAGSTQNRIYRQSLEANSGLLTFGESRSKEEVAFNALLVRHKKSQLVVSTMSGQDRFDFPDIIETALIEKLYVISGYVEWVSRKGFRISAIKFERQVERSRFRSSYSQQKDVLFRHEVQDVRTIGESALKAAMDRRRVLVNVHVAVRVLTGNIDYLILGDSKIEYLPARRR